MYPCHQCNLNAGRQSYFEINIESVHEKVRCLCTQCKYWATTTRILKTHTKSIPREIKVSLQSLWQTSYSKGKLKRHIESVQEKDKYQCNQCEYKTEA